MKVGHVFISNKWTKVSNENFTWNTLYEFISTQVNYLSGFEIPCPFQFWFTPYTGISLLFRTLTCTSPKIRHLDAEKKCAVSSFWLYTLFLLMDNAKWLIKWSLKLMICAVQPLVSPHEKRQHVNLWPFKGGKGYFAMHITMKGFQNLIPTTVIKLKIQNL